MRYEACVLALAEFRRTGFTDVVFGPATVLAVRVMAPSTEHTVTVRKIRAWLAVRGTSPHELLVKQKLREMLMGYESFCGSRGRAGSRRIEGGARPRC